MALAFVSVNKTSVCGHLNEILVLSSTHRVAMLALLNFFVYIFFETRTLGSE